MKYALLVLLLLIPLVYAEDSSLDARKASLDLRADEFIMKMNITVEFAAEKDIETNLSAIKSEFENKVKEALSVKTTADLKTKESELKNIAKKFKDETKSKLGSYAKEIREITKTNKENLKNKINVLDEKRKKLAAVEFDNKILQLRAKGNESRINQLLLKNFEKYDINATKMVKDDFDFGKTLSGVKDMFSSLKDFIFDKISIIGEK